jgi:hypothetical protein
VPRRVKRVRVLACCRAALACLGSLTVRIRVKVRVRVRVRVRLGLG